MAKQNSFDPIEQSVLNEWDAELDAAGREPLENPISRFFGILDILIKVRQKKTIAKAQISAEAKKGNKNAKRSLTEMFCSASEYANVSNARRNFTRFLIMLLPSFIISVIPISLLLADKPEMEGNQVFLILLSITLFIDIILTVLWKKISMPIMRFSITFLSGGTIAVVLAIIMLIWFGTENGQDPSIGAALITLVVTTLFFLFWNFWPQTRKIKVNLSPKEEPKTSSSDIDDLDLNVDSKLEESTDDGDIYDDLEEMK
jgi:hypothetical protein